MYEDLRNKNVLVTGGATGLGYAIAEAFAANHSNVIIVGRNREKLELAKIALGERHAVFALSREVGRSMVSRGTGSIIMMSSMASHYGIPKVIGYAASKAAVEGMTRTLAVDGGNPIGF